MTSTSPEIPTAGSVDLPISVETPRRSLLVQLITGMLSFLIIAVPSTLSGLFFWIQFCVNAKLRLMTRQTVKCLEKMKRGSSGSM